MQLILDSHFDQLEHFVNEVRHWDLDYRLLSTGGFEGSLKQLSSRDVMLTDARYTGSLDHRGTTPSGYRTFIVPGYTCKDYLWRGCQITQNNLVVYPLDNELQGSSNRYFEVFTISIRLDYIDQLIDDFCLKKLHNKQEVVRLEAHVAQDLLSLATTIIQSAGGEVAQVLARKLAEKLVIAAAESSPIKISNFRRRDIAVDKVLEFVRDSPFPTSELAHLCRVANVSERTLQYAFKERYSIAPNTFVKRWKLNTIRRQLLGADPVETNLSAVCQRFGFLHQSQFAADYKKLFAELPSETLKSQTSPLECLP